MKNPSNIEYAWKPQLGTQLNAILASWCPELFFGGARGGGKSDFLLGDFAQGVNIWQQHWNGVIFRRNYRDLEQLIIRSKMIYPLMGAVWRVGDMMWVWANGATLKMRHLENVDDADKYQGHEYTWIGFDELPLWPDDQCYSRLKACNRSSSGVPCVIRSTGNPGGRGQAWIKKYFIDPNPSGNKPIDTKILLNVSTGAKVTDPNQFDFLKGANDWQEINDTRMYIPSRLTDNKILMESDPTYINRLAQSGSEALVKAWIAGDWEAIEGAYFDKFDKARHVLAPFEIPEYWTKFRAFDWGFSAPFCCLWFAVSDGTIFPIPKGALIVYREYYGGSENKGLRLENSVIAKNILAYEEGETIDLSPADPAIFANQGGISIAEQFAREGCYFTPGDNKRLPGWQQIRTRLNPIDEVNPMIYFFDNCKNLIRTIPMMVHDEKFAEDMDSSTEDHALDTLRYGCMTRPVVTNKKPPNHYLNIQRIMHDTKTH